MKYIIILKKLCRTDEIIFYLINFGEVTLQRDHEGLVNLKILKLEYLSPIHIPKHSDHKKIKLGYEKTLI